MKRDQRIDLRVTLRQAILLRGLAKSAGQSLTAYILSKALPGDRTPGEVIIWGSREVR